MAKITLDSKTFQALASSTRLTVLRALDERRKTLTELARDLGLNKATVHEHLQLLTAAGLVRKRDDEGRKWIYYELTWTGERLLHPQETTTFSVLLGLTVAAAGGGVVLLGQALGWWLAGSRAVSEAQVEVTTRQDADAADQAQASAPEDPQGGGAGSASGTETQSAGASPPDGSVVRFAEPSEGESGSAPAAASDFGDSGWLGIVLLLASTVFLVLALAIRRNLRPKKGRAPVPDEPEEAAGGDGAHSGPPMN